MLRVPLCCRQRVKDCEQNWAAQDPCLPVLFLSTALLRSLTAQAVKSHTHTSSGDTRFQVPLAGSSPPSMSLFRIATSIWFLSSICLQFFSQYFLHRSTFSHRNGTCAVGDQVESSQSKFATVKAEPRVRSDSKTSLESNPAVNPP